MPDRIQETLRTLQPDIDRVGLADSAAVRRRGDRRTRNQAVGAGAAVLAVVAGVVGVAGGLTGDRQAVEGPPATDGPTVSTSQEPEPELALAAAPFLAPADLTGLGGYDRVGPFVDAGREPEILPEQCAARPGGWGAAEVRSTRYYQDGSEAEVRAYVLEFATEAAAVQAALKRAYSDLATCPATIDPSAGTLRTRDPEMPPGLPLNSAVRQSRYFVPEVASEPSYYEVASAHRANVVVVLEWQASANPAGEGASDWVWTAERLQAALGRAVAATS